MFKDCSISHPSFANRAILLLLGLLVSFNCFANGFGFKGPEIFPLDHQLFGMQAADLDRDGFNDLVLVNNLKSRITILYNRAGKPPRKPREKGWLPGQINELPPDARFERESILSEVRIGGLLLGDFNGDKRIDIVTYGEPKKFQLLLNNGRREWAEPITWELESGISSVNAIDQGDLNGDGLNDVALLADHFTHVFHQRKAGGFDDPIKIPFAGPAKSIRVLDVNMDGRDDLMTLIWEDDSPLRVRFQTADGELDEEVHLKYPRFRAFETDDLDGDGTLEWLTIGQPSGRAQVGRFDSAVKPKEFESRPLMMMPLLRTTAPERGILWSDLNGDGRSDLVFAESDQGLLQTRIQGDDGRYETGRRFPSLTGITQIRGGDWDGDGKSELFVFSPEEKQVGLIRIGKEGRLPFPELFSLKGRPIAMALGRLQAVGDLTLALLLDVDGKRSLYLRSAEGKGRTIALSKEFRANPSRMFFHDADQDGRRELVCLTPYEKITVLRIGKDDALTEIELVPPGGAIGEPSYGLADVDDDQKNELLLPQKNFVRAVVLEKRSESGTWSFRVKEQINGASRSSRVSGILSADSGELYFLDSGRRQISRCERNDDGVWTVVGNRKLPVNDFVSLVNVGMSEITLGLTGLNTVAWLETDDQAWAIEKVSDYESSVEQGRLLDIEVGDLNGDGQPNVLFLEGARNHLEIASLDDAGSLRSEVRWKVFEQKTFRGRGSSAMEPREAIIADLTGDDRNDIAVIVHDRVLLYPQE